MATPPSGDVGGATGGELAGLVVTFREYRRLIELVLGAVAVGSVPAGSALKELEASVGRVAAQLGVAGIDPAGLVAGERPACGCLCPMHRADGMGCEGEAAVQVTLVGGVLAGPRPVDMCGWCAGWWQRARPGRVAGVGGLL